MKQGPRAIGLFAAGMLAVVFAAPLGCASDEPGTTKTTKVTTVDGPAEKTTTTEKHEKKVEIDR